MKTDQTVVIDDEIDSLMDWIFGTKELENSVEYDENSEEDSQKDRDLPVLHNAFT